jgi:hypothetical protein
MIAAIFSCPWHFQSYNQDAGSLAHIELIFADSNKQLIFCILFYF